MNRKLKPVWISPEVTGGDAPLILSPQHSVLLRVDGADETLVRATHLSRLRGGKARVMLGCRKVHYFHVMFEAHQIIFTNGAPTGSFYLGPNAHGALLCAARREVGALFPEFDRAFAPNRYGAHVRRIARFCDLPNRLCDLAQVGP